MITRRGFISMLTIAGAGSVLVPNRTYFLSAEPNWEAIGAWYAAQLRKSMAHSMQMAFRCNERFSDPVTDWRAVYGSSDKGVAMAVRPSRLIVHPDKVESAKLAFPGKVEIRYFADPNAWYLKTDAPDMKMASRLERHALASGIHVRGPSKS